MHNIFKKKKPANEDLGSVTPEYRIMAEILTMITKNTERTSKWSSLFRLSIILYVVLMTIIAVGAFSGKGESKEDKKHVAVVELNGAIDASGEASADKIVSGLRAALKAENSIGVIVRANSPGGSPVQSAYVNDEIYRLRAKYPEKPIYFVITDMCASGCYYMAAAADKIYANKGSIVGSIGVIMNGFGFTGTMEKLGVERRMLTSGESKGMLDPFSPLKEADVAHTKQMLNVIHEQFIDVVKKGRGDKLADNEHLFSGRFWAGSQALELGLVDGLLSTTNVARDEFDTENLVNYTVHNSKFNKVFEKFGAKASLSDVLASSVSLR